MMHDEEMEIQEMRAWRMLPLMVVKLFWTSVKMLAGRALKALTAGVRALM